MLTHWVTRGWVLILGRSLELFFRELAVSGVATRDKHRVPDGKLLERNKSNSFQVTTDLLNSNTLKVAIAELCNEL